MSTSEVNFSEEKTVHDDVVSSKDGELGTESNEYSEKNFNQIHSMIADGSLELPITEVDFVLSKVSVLTVEESLDILKRSVAAHKDDVNFPEKNMFLIEDLLKGPEQATTDRDTWELNLKTQAALNGFHSPYPEVRAVTDPYDDDKAPCETIRAYILGIIWVLIGTGVNQFFSPRFPSIYLTPAIFQMLLYPCGRLMQLIPDWGFTIMGTRHSFNPGPWSQKEQMFTTLMVSVSVGGAYVTLYNFIVQKSPVFYGNQWVGPGYQFLLTISTQFLGFGFAGMLRRLVIYPPKAVWPTILPTLALNRALMKPEIKENINGWTISRYYFFFIVFACSFIYFWLPNYLFGALSYFNWMTWIAPDNFNLANVTGSIIGLGINPISTFDWNVATSLLQPLAIPFFSFINQYSGQFLSAFFILGVFYSNHLWSGYLPINENSLFDNQGNTYKITSILDSKGLVDPQKYANYSPPFYSAANLVLYGAFFAIYPLSFIYIGLQEWKGICVAFKDLYLALRHPSRSQFEGQDDLHTTMMSRYPEVPDWWFYIILLMSFVLGCVCLEVYPTETPIWSLVLTIVINFVFLIPITIITAYTGFSFGLNVLVELIVGYALPGNPQALMILKAFGYNIDGQASNYISDQKMGHYAKVPPRALFRGQMIATVFQILVSIGVVNWQLGNVENFCSPKQAQKFICAGARTFYTASITWGAIGPKRMFGDQYSILQWCFLIGALLAPVCFYARKFFPKQLKYFNPIVFVGGMLNWAPYNLTYLTTGLYASIFFMYYIRRRYVGWWEKYNYLISAGMAAGVAFSAVIIFFSVQYHPKSVSWWGNDVSYAGVDGGVGRQVLISDLPEAGYFGPTKGSWN